MNEPIFLSIVRSLIPKEGASLGEAKNASSRLKRKVKKALVNAGYEVETVRGIGVKFSHYGLKYSEKDNTLFADFVHKDEMPTSGGGRRGKGKRGSKKKASPLITGYHSVTAELSDEEFVAQVCILLPADWERQTLANDVKWMTFDITILRQTGKSPDQVAKLIVDEASESDGIWGEVYFIVLKIHNTTMIGVGPL